MESHGFVCGGEYRGEEQHALDPIFRAFRSVPGFSPRRLFLDAITTMAMEAMQASGLPDCCDGWHETQARNYAGNLDGHARIVKAIAEALLASRYSDVLGQVYDRLEIGNIGKGQFLTPGRVAGSMSRMANMEKHIRLLETQPVVRVCDATCGSGVFLLSVARAAHEAGHDPADRHLLEGMDIDGTMSRMCYLQLAYNGLTGTVRDFGSGHVYPTPLYLGLLRTAAAISAAGQD